MGKKSRRKTKRRAGDKLVQRAPIEPAQTKAMLESKAATSSVGPSVLSTQTTRYQYILPELRLIGIISGSLFLILIVLALFLS